MQELTSQPVNVLLLFAGAVFLAAVVRGFTGFGFSALVVTMMFFIMPVSQIVPVVYALEVVASLQMLKSVWRQVDIRIFLLLAAGAVIGTPLGQYILLALTATQSKQLASILVLILVVLVASGFRIKSGNKALFFFVVGLLGGCINGAIAMGGLVISALLMATSLSVASIRASLVVILFFLGVYSLASGSMNGLVTINSLWLAGLMILPMIIGIILGSRLFHPGRSKLYRRVTLVLLALLAVNGLLR